MTRGCYRILDKIAHMVHVMFKYTSLASNPSPRFWAQPPFVSAKRPLQVRQAKEVSLPIMGKATWVVTKSWPRTPLLVAVRSALHDELVVGTFVQFKQF